MSDTHSTPANEPESADLLRDLNPRQPAEMEADQLKGGETVNGTVVTNILYLQHETQKRIVQNLRA